MILGEMTWQEVRDASRELVCVIPTGSLEQHGPHLPLLTDTLLCTAVAKQAEVRTADKSLLLPGIWLGCSAHHMAMDGTATASSQTYVSVLTDVVTSFMTHGFRKFLVLNGHGGNTEQNGVALRELKRGHPNDLLSHADYYGLVGPDGEKAMQGPLKTIRHSCEAEVSMMLHLHQDLVRVDKLRDDGLTLQPKAPARLSIIQNYDEITEEGSFGYSTFGTAETGKTLVDLAVKGVSEAIEYVHAGYSLAR
ncbi:MAG: creatininase family protein [Armatimonadetes bacterium]|nr:creatininase family protein [Armatimonadota bacterium]